MPYIAQMPAKPSAEIQRRNAGKLTTSSTNIKNLLQKM
jgi:hypothetical protein